MVAAICLAAGLALVPSVQGQEPANRAGLVIQHGDGTVFSTCVSFEEPSISGLELLRRAGVSITADSSSGFGVSICALDGEGCNYPDENCFCQCQGATCRYWIYWHLGAEGWQYAQLGASDRKVTDGSVDGWIWGTGDPSSGEEPPAASFDEICGAELSSTLTTASAKSTQKVKAQSVVGATATPVQTLSLEPTATPVPTADVTGQLCSANYLAFLTIVVILAGIMIGQIRRG